jgi:hypothetical protein
MTAADVAALPNSVKQMLIAGLVLLKPFLHQLLDDGIAKLVSMLGGNPNPPIPPA